MEKYPKGFFELVFLVVVFWFCVFFLFICLKACSFLKSLVSFEQASKKDKDKIPDL